MEQIDIKTYETLRKNGHTEEQALFEAKTYFKPHKNDDEYVTKKDLKIALMEFAEKYKLGLINFKMNAIFWALGALFTGIATGLWYVFKLLIEILGRLPS